MSVLDIFLGASGDFYWFTAACFSAFPADDQVLGSYHGRDNL